MIRYVARVSLAALARPNCVGVFVADRAEADVQRGDIAALASLASLAKAATLPSAPATK